ncbi:hypothetical protein G9U51_10275 [Calidifontibacter sp. DB0510]|uniref:Immunity protein 63 domain-containing protein n=1 Tax=Metallococcus carri TaxID=1656884 RepID=A0A967EHC3_9MICO|nr:Imm63 family immunity protein [Metallococcus carri]NHN56163.1 hypothetical protein [Metallococcus carri]NOP38786.1 hypothetical protein [Calidifontibacter sp. DB2511S]
MAESARLAEVARRVDECVAMLHAQSGLRPWHVTDTECLDAGFPYYREEHGRLFYRVQEKGRTLREDVVDDVEELVHLVMVDLVSEVAGAYELAHRRKGEDTRRQWFHLTEAWLTAMDPRWGALERERQALILRAYPFSS